MTSKELKLLKKICTTYAQNCEGCPAFRKSDFTGDSCFATWGYLLDELIISKGENDILRKEINYLETELDNKG